jgi:anti-sigma regulatory factor (Ser/Thr protein kinase)
MYVIHKMQGSPLGFREVASVKASKWSGGVPELNFQLTSRIEGGIKLSTARRVWFYYERPMPTNYQALQQDPRDAARKAVHRLMRYSEQVHFVYELLQNADDAGKHGNEEKSVRMGFVLRDNELVVWNDGRAFDERDITGVLAIGQSSKDLTQIGAFGIGFKSIYVYTDRPEIYSGAATFRIQNYLEADGIPETPADIKQWTEVGKTVFRLPFKANLRETSLPSLKHRLRNADLRSLLFLRRLCFVEWQDSNGESGEYVSERKSFTAIQNAERVVLSAKVVGLERAREEWLVVHSEATPPK